MSPHSWRLWDPKTENDDLIQDAVLQAWLSQVPPWRKAVGNHKLPGDDDLFKAALKREEKGETWIVPAADSDDFERIIQRIHMALWLRRPLLVEGAPGIGKSSLAYALAYRFGLGRVLKWEISSRSRKQDGLYSYDSVSHFRQIQENQSGGNPEETSEISNFIRLGPLGSALLGGDKLGDFLKPRVLLVDELDKADYDLPNDLLHVLEDAKFEISELPGNLNSVIETHEGWQTNAVQKQIICNAHPVVVITSNSIVVFVKQHPTSPRRVNPTNYKRADILRLGNCVGPAQHNTKTPPLAS